ncbi:MAG TPA: hypothetical protein DHW82_06610 [Spirochaetia bacterium]|nr:MAG: hypothetical protein A2Y41_08710 [Spirochaetes bacterium GWB1_36_13]HCL56665.1 hypothetical protein [Spirochaetia bacterium]
MKKIILLISALALLVFSSCGKKDSNKGQEGSNNTLEQQQNNNNLPGIQSIEKDAKDNALTQNQQTQQQTVVSSDTINENTTYADLEQWLDKDIEITGEISDIPFTHRAFFYPGYPKIAHFNLDANYSGLAQDLPFLVMYFKKEVDVDKFYIKSLGKKMILQGTFHKVDGSFLNPDKQMLKERKAHPEFFITVKNLKEK